MNKLKYLIIAVSSLWLVHAHAWVEPGITISTGFYSISSTDSYGTTVKLSSKPALDLRPDWVWVSDDNIKRFIVHGIVKDFKFDVAGSVSTIQDNDTYYFGLGMTYQRLWGLSQYSLGLEVSQRPFAYAIDDQNLALKKLFVLSVPLELSRKLIILERQAIRAGVDGSIIISALKDIKSGYRVRGFLRHELRHAVKFETTLFYELRSTKTTSVTQAELEMGFNFRISFPGKPGLTPPPFEHD